MTMVQMNVRIDAKLKNEVEEVLKGKGVSMSDVIRSLWLYIADRKEVPALETTAEEQARLEEIPAKIEEEKKKIFKPIFGCECYCARNGRHSKLASQNDRSGWHLIVLAKNLNGYKNLIKMVSLSWTEGFTDVRASTRSCWKNIMKT